MKTPNNSKPLKNSVRRARALAGAKGGAATGKPKTRTKAHYQRAAAARWARAKAKGTK